MSRAHSLKEDSFQFDDPISKISERISKKEQIEMNRQLSIMVNRIKLLAFQKQKLQVKQQQIDVKIEYINNIRNQYHQHSERVQYDAKTFILILIIKFYLISNIIKYLRISKLSTIQKNKEIRNQSLQLYKDIKNQQKQDQIKLQQQIRLTIQQQKLEKFQQMKLQSLKYDKFITLQKERSKSFNVEKKQQVQQQEQQIQQNLQQYKQLKQQQFKSQHKQVVLNNYLQKANDFVKIHQLWDLEKSILDSMNNSTNSKFNISLTKA